MIRNCDELLRADWFWLEVESTTWILSKFDDVPAACVGAPDPTILLLANDAAAADEPCPWRRGRRSSCCLAAYNHKIFLINCCNLFI